MSGININHNEGSITTTEDKVLQITENGAVKIGNGTYLDELGNPQIIGVNELYEGAIRYNKDRGCIQYCDGTSWKDFTSGSEETSGIIWAITF